MNIRALTGFLDPGWPLRPERLAHIAENLNSVKEGLHAAGYTVQTLRLATPPPMEMQNAVSANDRIEFAKQLEAECFAQGIDYAAIGPALPDDLEDFTVIPAILENTDSVFVSGLFADPAGGLSLQAAAACAEVIQKVSIISDDGFANLRFAALANVPSGSPFFPAAYHRPGPPAIGIATEAADLAVTAFKDGISIQSATRLLVEAIEGHASVISKVLKPIAEKHEIRFQGIDFSLAPYPEEARSLGTALKALGVPAAGLSGSVTAAAVLAQCLDQAQFERTGFCGLFLPVLEDSILAFDAGEGNLTINDLLLSATICGTGLDTIPLPGDTSVESIYALLLDLGVLALRHDKPLTARLMPIPGKQAGDDIAFDFPYFADSRVMSLNALPLGGELASDNPIVINPHPSVSGPFPTT
jgi:uncharacterized protein (UPF0210 family)